MTVHFATFERITTAETDIQDVTEQVESVLRATKITDGLVVVGVAGSTASITTIEYESGAVNDLRRAIGRMAPPGLPYEHDARWGDGNGYAHVRAAMLGPSVTIALRAGQLMLGTWQQIVLCDFDNRPRKREVYVQVVGE